MEVPLANRDRHELVKQLATLDGCRRVLDEFLERPASTFGRPDVGMLNLLCAPTLPGSENLNVPKCLDRLDRLTDAVRGYTDRHLPRCRDDPAFGHSESTWRMAALVTVVKRDFGAAYHPVARGDLLAGADALRTDSRHVFIHGLLGEDDPARRWGTCASIPVLVVAVARRLGYPVSLAVAGSHIYARWEGRERFNVEASNPMGMTVHPNAYYRAKCGGLVGDEQRRSSFYVRALVPAEEFALFLQGRVFALRDAARYDATLLWSARALQFAPDDLVFPHVAHQVLDVALRHRVRARHPDRRIPPPDAAERFTCNLVELLAPLEWPPVLTIIGHYREALGELDAARAAYEDACRRQADGVNEQRDLQRFVRKYGPRRRSGPPLPPVTLGQPRRMMPRCRPEEEAAALRHLADAFERRGEWVQARDALHDLYLFDPADGAVFDRAREIERRPQFVEQLKALYEEHRRALEASGALLQRRSRTP